MLNVTIYKQDKGANAYILCFFKAAVAEGDDEKWMELEQRLD